MAKVKNWQIGREMEYPYEENRPQKQIAYVFDINKCIACQTCSVACKTTWTSGKGEETMFWNNVETKPYGGYPLRWDSRLSLFFRSNDSPVMEDIRGKPSLKPHPRVSAS